MFLQGSPLYFSSTMARRTTFLLISFVMLSLVVVSGASPQDQEDSQDKAPEPTTSSENDSNNQLSWQSAFWALVGIAVNTAIEPSGSIIGFPASWGPALKCSPVFCIINAFEALRCVRILPGLKLLVVPDKYDTDESSARTDVAALQRNTLLRVVAFVLGPAMQATKLFACSGIFCTKLLAGIYLGSFLCDELVLCLIWSTGSNSKRGGAAGLVEAILSRPVEPETQKTEYCEDDGDGTSKLRQFLALNLACVFIFWFAGNAAAGLDIVLPLNDAGYLLRIGILLAILLGGFILGPLCGVRPWSRTSSVAWRCLEVLIGMMVPHCLSLFVIAQGSEPMLTVLDDGTINFYGNVTWWSCYKKMEALLLTWFVAVYALFRFSNMSHHCIPKPVRLSLAIWTCVHVATVLVLYCLSYDSSNTYQPSWTNVLG